MDIYEQRFLSGKHRDDLLKAIHAIWDGRLNDAQSILQSIRRTENLQFNSDPILDDFDSLLQYFLEFPDKLKYA